MFCYPLKFNRSKVKFFIFFSKLFYPPDFPISLSAQSSQETHFRHFGFCSPLPAVRHEFVYILLFLCNCSHGPSHFILCHLLSGLRWCTPSPLVYLSFLSPFNLFCNHCHINLPWTPVWFQNRNKGKFCSLLEWFMKDFSLHYLTWLSKQPCETNTVSFCLSLCLQSSSLWTPRKRRWQLVNDSILST